MEEAKEKQLDADDLKRIRKSLKLTQKDMAEKLEISRSMIAMIEKGKAKLSIETASKLKKIKEDNNVDLGTSSLTVKIGDRIRYVRTALLLTIEEFAKLLNIPAQTLYDYEKHNKEVPTDLIEYIGKEFEVPREWLFENKGEFAPIRFHLMDNRGFSPLHKRDELSKMLGRVYSNRTPQAQQKRDLLYAILKLNEEDFEKFYTLSKKNIKIQESVIAKSERLQKR